MPGRFVVEGEVRAMGFAAIVCGNVAMILAYRSARGPNPALWWIVVLTIAALLASIYLPAAAEVFRFAPLGAADLVAAALGGIAGVAAYQAIKLARG